MHVGETISIMSHLPKKKKSYFGITGKVLMQQLSVSFWQWSWAGLSVEILVYARFLPPDKEQSTHSTLKPSQSASSPSVTSSPSYKQGPAPQRTLGWDHVHLLITKNKNQSQMWTCWLLIIIRQTTTWGITEISWITTGCDSKTLSGTWNPKK